MVLVSFDQLTLGEGVNAPSDIWEGGRKKPKKEKSSKQFDGEKFLHKKNNNIQTNQTKNILARKIVLHDNFAQLPLPKASPLKYLVVHS